MDFQEGLMTRRSIRGFKDTPVTREQLTEVLTMGIRSVNALNSQPWHFIVLTGELKDKIAQRNIECFLNSEDLDVNDAVLVGRQRTNKIDVAKQLFAAMDIAREDTAKRNWWTQRGFGFFDAPAVILIALDKDCDPVYHRLDIGAVSQNIALAAHSFGLGTCIELQAVMYQKGIREYLPEHADKHFVVGIAIGYPDEDFPANQVVSKRDAVDDVTTWYGFEE